MDVRGRDLRRFALRDLGQIFCRANLVIVSLFLLVPRGDFAAQSVRYVSHGSP